MLARLLPGTLISAYSSSSHRCSGRGPPKAHGAALRFLVLLGWLLPGSAQAAAALPPGLEAEVAHLLFMRPGESPLPGGYQLGNVAIEAEQVRVQLVGPEGEGEVLLLPGLGGGEDTRLDSASFRARLPPSAPASFAKATSGLMRRLRNHDDGSFLSHLVGGAGAGPKTEFALRAQHATMPPSGSREDDMAARSPAPWESERPTRSPLAPPWVLVDLVLILFLLLGGWELWTVFRGGHGRDFWIPVFGGLLLFGLALGLRLALPPWAPLHANEHGVLELGGLAGLWPGEGARRASLYGPAYLRLLAPGARLLAWPQWPLFAGALSGAACVPIFFALGRRLSGQTVLGLVAALVLALHPGHIRLSASASPWPLALTLFGLGSLLLARGLDPERQALAQLRTLGAGTAALALALQLRLLTLILGPLALLMVLSVSPLPTQQRLKRLGVPSLLLAGVSLSHLYEIHNFAGAGMARVGGSMWTGMWRALAVTSSFSSPVFLGLAILGLVAWGWRGSWLLAAVLAAPVLLLATLSQGVLMTCRTDTLRYGVPLQVFLVLGAAGLVLLLPESKRVLGGAALGILLVASLLPGASFALRQDLNDQAFGLASRAAARLPAQIELRTPPRWMAGRRVQSVYPEYLLSTQGVKIEHAPSTGRRCFVALGPACYAFTEEELQAGPQAQIDGEPARRECASLGFRLPTKDSDLARRVIPGWRDKAYHHILAQRPWIGLLPCLEDPSSRD